MITVARVRHPLAALSLAVMLAVGLSACGIMEENKSGSAASAIPANDNLNAVLWTQHSVEFKGNAEGAFALARIRLDQALKDRKWTAAPAEQTGKFGKLPPAVVLDVDETLLDNSAYHAWNITAGTSFDPKTWTASTPTRAARTSGRRSGRTTRSAGGGNGSSSQIRPTAPSNRRPTRTTSN
jgi:predicted secreted acid phosphatase